MLASQHYGIQRSPLDDWFDPLLNADTKLFIDPFLVFRDRYGWRDAHQDLLNHFEHAFRLIAEGNLDIRSLPYRKAVRLLAFREPKEFCLGYTARGTAGSGGRGRGRAQRRGGARWMCPPRWPAPSPLHARPPPHPPS